MGWLVSARMLRRYWIRTIVPHGRGGTCYSSPEVTIYAMFLALLWPVLVAYLLVATDLPKKIRHRYDHERVQSMEMEIHGQVMSQGSYDSDGGPP